MTTIFLTIGIILLMLPSFIFIAMMLPGVLYLFIIALIYGLFDHFTHMSLHELAILGGIAVVSIVIDQIAGFIGAHWGGARGKTFLYGIGGVVAGNIVFPIIGGFVGLFVGILTGEMIRRRRIDAGKSEVSVKNEIEGSLKAAAAGLIGAVAGIIINICLAILFIGLFLVFVI